MSTTKFKEYFKFAFVRNLWDRVCEEINIDKKLPKRNSTGTKDYKEYYNSTTRLMIHDMYREDIENFNYR